MSTAVDTAFADLVSATEDAGEPMHGVCDACYPNSYVPAGAIAICGFRIEDGGTAGEAPGQHKCSKCLTLQCWSCGHRAWR